MPVALRPYDPQDFPALYRLDQSCFPPGIAYSKTTLRYFLSLRSADCLVATEDAHIAGFIVTEENPPLAHIITLDVAEKYRRQGIGSVLLAEIERNLALRGVRHLLLETATDNAPGVAFWQRHGYRIEATLKRYYLGRLDAYEMRKILSAPTSVQPAPAKSFSTPKKAGQTPAAEGHSAAKDVHSAAKSVQNAAKQVHSAAKKSSSNPGDTD
jgi:[ribosomal protein S18]-alanine N-acetyltransferase